MAGWRDRAVPVLGETPDASPAPTIAPGASWRDRAVSDGAQVAPPARRAAPSELESAGTGALEGASVGFDDEIGAGIQALMAKLGGTGDLGATYAQARYENRGRKHAARDANPKSYAAGGLVGALASPATLATGGLAGAGMGTLAAAGALQGGLAAMGHNEDLRNLTQDELPAMALGTVLGGAAPEAGRLITAAAKPLLNAGSAAARKLAGFSAMKATGATGANFRRIAQEAGHDVERPIEVGQELLDRGAVPWFGDAKSIRERVVGTALPAANAERQAAVKALDETGASVDLPRIAADLDQRLVTPRSDSRLPDTQQLGADIRAKLGAIGGGEAPRRAPFGEAERLLGDVQEQGYELGDPAYKKIAPGLRQALRSEADAIAGPEGAAYKASKDSLNRLLAAQKVLDARVPMGEGNSLVPLTGTIVGAGAGGAAAGSSGLLAGGLTGLGAAVGVKLLKERGPAMAANTFNSLSKALAATPEALGHWAPVLTQAAARSPAALAATHRALMTSDPAYFEAWSRQSEAEAAH